MAFDNTNFLEADAATEADFTFTDRAGAVDSLLQATNTAGQWCLGNGTTTSGGTGPTSNPAGRSGFVYTETSTPSASSTWAMRRKTSFDSTTQNVFLDLIYNLNVDVGSEFYIEYATVASPNETTDWTILETISGTLTDAWISDTFDFTGISSTTLWLRIRFNSLNAFTNDLAFSTWREYSVDTSIDGAGLMLSSADRKQTTAGIEDPAVFGFQKSLPWGAITLAMRLDTAGGVAQFTPGAKYKNLDMDVINTDTTNIDGWTINGDLKLDVARDLTNVTVTGDLNIQTAGTYNFSNVTVLGDTLNNDAAGNALINASNGSSLTTTTPGAGNGQVDIQNTVNVSVKVLDDKTSLPVEFAHVLLLLSSDKVTQVLNATTDALGLASISYNFSSDVSVEGWVRQSDLLGTDYIHKDISGTVTGSGLAIISRITPT